MDQRNAGGQSRAPITAQDGWDSYTADHIALLDHLGIDRCHLYGQCIGGSFIINLLKAQPERVASAVLAQPIGRVGALMPGRPARFNAWAESLEGHPEATQPVLDAFCHNLYAAGFVYCADRGFVSTIRTPCLVLAGNDEAHPWPISEELAKLLPNCEFIAEWKAGAALTRPKPASRSSWQSTPRPGRSRRGLKRLLDRPRPRFGGRDRSMDGFGYQQRSSAKDGFGLTAKVAIIACSGAPGVGSEPNRRTPRYALG